MRLNSFKDKVELLKSGELSMAAKVYVNLPKSYITMGIKEKSFQRQKELYKLLMEDGDSDISSFKDVKEKVDCTQGDLNTLIGFNSNIVRQLGSVLEDPDSLVEVFVNPLVILL